jgi:hypothetical protein
VPLECQVHLVSAHLKQVGDFDNARHILGIPGAPWAEAGPGSLDLCSRSVSGCSSRRRQTAPPPVTPARVLGGGISLACALRCWAFGSFGRRVRGDAPPKVGGQSEGPHLYQILKFAKTTKLRCSSSSASVRHATRTQVSGCQVKLLGISRCIWESPGAPVISRCAWHLQMRLASPGTPDAHVINQGAPEWQISNHWRNRNGEDHLLSEKELN